MLKIHRNAKIGNLRHQFCEVKKLECSSIKFLFDGQRVRDQDTANSLGLMDGDIIEAFKEMKGGGWEKNKRKNISEDRDKILDVLESCSVEEESSESDEEVHEPNVHLEERDEKNNLTTETTRLKFEEKSTSKSKEDEYKSVDENQEMQNVETIFSDSQKQKLEDESENDTDNRSFSEEEEESTEN